jgi:hypothetical protein
MNQSELDNLSDEEREALEGEEIGTAGEVEAAAKAAESIQEDASAGDPAPEEAAAVEVEAATEDFTPRLVPPVADVTDEELSALLDKRKAIREQYRQGDLSAEEKDAQEDELTEQITRLRTAQSLALFVEENNQRQAEIDHMKAIAEVKADVREKDGVDYDNNPMLLRNWDLKVRALAADPANAGKPSKWYLSEAHKQVKTELESAAAALGFVKPSNRPSAESVRDAVNSRRPAPTTAKSLSTLPAAAADTGREGAEFGHLDALNGDDLEAAVARMSPEQQERWART